MEYEIVPQTIEAFLFDSDPIDNFHMEVLEVLVLEVLEIHNLEVEMIHLGNMQIETETKNT